jgi:hypothetical protein
MTPNMIVPALKHCRSIGRAAFIWGAVGVGKSELVAGMAKEEKIGLIDFRMAMRDPTDIKGFPMPDAKKKTMVFYRDDELPTSGEGILFLDELNSAMPATQAAGMQLTLTGRIGDYTLPPGWSIVAAGNRETDRSIVNRMPAALSNRFIHIDYEVNVADWCSWALENGVSDKLVAFIRFRPHLLHKPDYNERAFPTPRSNVFADQHIKANLPRDIEYELLKGTTGAGHAGELTAYLRICDELPSFEAIMNDPGGLSIPNGTGVLYAIATMLGVHATKKNVETLMAYIERMPTEYQIVTVRDALKRDEDIAETPAYIRWGIANAAVTM